MKLNERKSKKKVILGINKKVNISMLLDIIETINSRVNEKIYNMPTIEGLEGIDNIHFEIKIRENIISMEADVDNVNGYRYGTLRLIHDSNDPETYDHDTYYLKDVSGKTTAESKVWQTLKGIVYDAINVIVNEINNTLSWQEGEDKNYMNYEIR